MSFNWDNSNINLSSISTFRLSCAMSSEIYVYSQNMLLSINLFKCLMSLNCNFRFINLIV